jgi:hypothetical protein
VVIINYLSIRLANDYAHSMPDYRTIQIPFIFSYLYTLTFHIGALNSLFEQYFAVLTDNFCQFNQSGEGLLE